MEERTLRRVYLVLGDMPVSLFGSKEELYRSSLTAILWAYADLRTPHL